MEASCLATEAADIDGDSDPAKLDLMKTEDGVYIESLVTLSLLLVGKDFSPEVQSHGSKMLKYLLKNRSDKLSSADFLKLNLRLYNAKSSSEDGVMETAKLKEQSLLVGATKNSLKCLNVQKTGGGGDQDEGAVEATTNSSSISSPPTFFLSSGKRPLISEDERIDFSLALDPSFHCSPSSSSPSQMLFKSLGQRPWFSDKIIGLTITLSYLVDPQHLCYPSYSYGARSRPKSLLPHGVFRWFGRRLTQKHIHQIDHTLHQKNLLYSLSNDPYLNSLPFPIEDPLPISWFGLGTKSAYRNAQKRLDSSLESDESTNSRYSSISNENNSSSSSGNSHESSPGKSDGSNENNRSKLGKGYQKSNRSITVMGNNGAMLYHQTLGCSLFTEHILLCEALVIATKCSGIEQSVRILPFLLTSVNKIWIQKEWNNIYMHNVSGMGRLFSDIQFLKMAHYVVKFCEEQLKRSCDIFSIALLKSILCFLLRLLRCIHALWKVEAEYDLYNERTESLSCGELSHMLESTDGTNIDNENETRALLEGIRQRGYSFIGLCTFVKGAFSDLSGRPLLDSQVVGDALMEDLEYMELRHLGRIICLIITPLVKRCPSELWMEWIDNFLKPVLIQCEYKLHVAWFNLLYNGRAKETYYFGNPFGLDEEIQELEQKILLKFTREMSGLLVVLAREEKESVVSTSDDNASLQDLESTASSSFFRFLLHHDCFGMLRMSLFGYFVDDEAAVNAIPFCHSLIRLAASINDDAKFRIFIMGYLLPYVIRRIDNNLQCATQSLIHKLSSSSSDSGSPKLLLLCEKIYDYCLLKGFSEEAKNIGSNFRTWFEKRKSDQVEASSATKKLLNGSEWNWEFEDDFQRYLPIYMDMLQEVDSMDDYGETDFVELESLFKKLKPEFKSKYGINSCVHPYMVTLSYLRQRQYYSMSGVVYNRKKGEAIKKLIKLKPYIKASDSESSVICRLKRNSDIEAELPEHAVLPSVDLLRSVLSLWEPTFHPLIRKSHMDILLWFVDQITKAKEKEDTKQVIPSPSDFEFHLQPYADTFIETKLRDNKYYDAIEQISLHEEFDSHLASAELDCHIHEFANLKDKDGFVKNLVEKRTQFSVLDPGLIKLSLERRAKLLSIRNDVYAYSKYLGLLLHNEQLKGLLKSLMDELQEEGFFHTDNDSINWEKKRFSELVDEFNEKVFQEHSLPKHYVLRGIIDYRFISTWKDRYQQDAFREVVGGVCRRWIQSFERFWRETRYYEHRYYDISRRPLEMVLTK